MLKPADRLRSVAEYYFSRKLKEIALLNEQGQDIISLAIGSPDMPPTPQTIDTLCAVAHDAGAHGYQPTMGIPELRQAMAAFYKRTYGVPLNAESEILPLIGSKEGILHITLAFVNNGEEVLVPNPGYPTYTSLSTLLGARVVYYDLDERTWQPDFEQIEAMDLRRVKLIWTNYPHMPTGGNAQRATYERLVALAQRHNVMIVNDNPYSLILNEHPLSIMQVEGAKDCCLELNSLSKSFNMPGWRVGMVIGAQEHINYILKVKSNIDSGTFRAVQLAAAEALTTTTPQWHREYNVNIYRRRRHIAEAIMAAIGCTYDAQQVGMFLWGRIPEHYASAEALTEHLLHHARVFITPGFIFGTNGQRYIRISLCASDERMRQALQRIKSAVGSM